VQVELDGITRVVDGETHLAGIGGVFPAGLHVLLGRTGAGKTSLLRVIAGLDRADRGRVLTDGRDVTTVPVAKRGVAFVYQQFVNYPSFTVRRNISAPLEIAKVAPAEIERRVKAVAAMLHLETMLDRLPAQLSGGQQQRLAIARALAKESSLLLLDEPLGNLDYKLREELRRELKDLVGARPAGVVFYATSDPLEALEMGGTVWVLHEGRLLQHGPALDVWRRPATATVGAVFDDPPMSFLDAELIQGEIHLDGAEPFAAPTHLAALAPGRWRLGVRADHLRTRPSSPSDPKLPASIELSEVTGSETVLHARVGAATVVAREAGVHGRALGEHIDLFLRAGSLLAFHPADGTLAAAPQATR